MNRSGRHGIWVLLPALCLGLACGDGEIDPRPRTPPEPRPPTGEALFTDAAAELGIDYVHDNGMWGEFYLSEIIGPGGALVDYDADGDLDIFIVQGHRIGAEITAETPRDRLYRNELVETGKLGFVDVTAESGIDSPGYGMGVAVGDYDADGFPDLYVTNFGPNLLLKNNGDGTFRNVTAEAGAGDERWSTSAAFVDYDADGNLDLFVANYVDFTLNNHKPCFSESSARDYCGPSAFSPYPDRLLRNNGNGSFEDVTATSRIAQAYGAGLGVVCSDLNGDGLTDIYVANDGLPNQLWLNNGDGTFRDEALLAGCALDEGGKAEGSMGIDAADFDGDGDEDLFMTHLNDETNTLYLNDGTGMFEDYSMETGLGVPSRSSTGFGTTFLDYDNDGWLDLIVANGAVKSISELVDAGDPYPFHQPNQIFRNLGGGRFEEVSSTAGAAFEPSEVSRGAAFGDIDNDGDTDVLILNNNGPARLLVNQVGNRNSWIGLRVTDAAGHVDQIGARVEVLRENEQPLRRHVRTAASYCSANDARVLVGLGNRDLAADVLVHWVDGPVERWSDLPTGKYSTLRRGSGAKVDG